MALGSKSLHCILLVIHCVVVVIALSVLVVSSLSLGELMDKRPFVEGKYKTKPAAKSEVEVWNHERLIGDPEEREDGTDEKGSSQGTITGPAILLVAVSAATLMLTAWAFYSTLKMNVHLLRAFIILMALALAVQISAGIWALVARSRCDSPIRASLIGQLTEYEVGAGGGAASAKKGAPRWNAASPATSLWTHHWDALQWQMKCCGVEGPDDYFGRGAIPLSCCGPAASTVEKADPTTAPKATPPPPTGFVCHAIKSNGCLDSLVGFVREKLLWVGTFAIGGTFVEVIPLMLTVAYTISIKRDLQKIYR